MLKSIFKKNNYIVVSSKPLDSYHEEKTEVKPSIPDGMWTKCPHCFKILYKEDIDRQGKVCNYCKYNFRLNPRERLEMILDEGSFKEFYTDIIGGNPLSFPDYDEKKQTLREKLKEDEAVVCGEGYINGNKVLIGVMNSEFLMGSMGCVVGEKLTRLIEEATALKTPLIIFTASGGARMQEGILSLMQMAKVSGALNRFHDAGGLYITVLTDPTTGGVTASFAMLGDIIISEPRALIGFAGRRVIEKTIGEKLPDDFQSAEFLLENGFVDMICKRAELKSTLSKILMLHGGVRND